MRLSGLTSLLALVTATMSPAVEAGEYPSRVKERIKAEMDKLRFVPGKYFHESNFHDHYDGRFAEDKLAFEDQRAALSVLIQTYLATMRDLHIDTWIMHGSLLGWWFNKESLPWDDDADVMITEPGIFNLASYYNMTTYYFEYPSIPNGRTFLLEVNPNYTKRDESDFLNVVDARWIDMENGLFIDITAARYAFDHPEGEGVMVCKDGHQFKDKYVFPLLETTFHGVPAKVPYRYQDFLIQKYGEKSLTKTEQHDHKFDEKSMSWTPTAPLSNDL